MTAERLHKLMTIKVVPEKLIPQNIVSFLMDENAELPELDAFTFLNRLRALGISSGDFIDLLGGCGAPREVVDKIARNPAMNLQALIVTLNGAGLNSKDYTRMLYTARQLWEHTVTMRIESVRGNEDYAEGFGGSELIGEESAEKVDSERSVNTESYINTESCSDEQLIENAEPANTESHDDVLENNENGDETEQPDYYDYDEQSDYYESEEEDEFEDISESVGEYRPSETETREDTDSGGSNALPESGEGAESDDDFGYINTQNSSGEFPSISPTSTFAAIDIDEIKRAMNKPVTEKKGGSERTDPAPAEKREPSEKPYTPVRGGYHNGAITVWAAGAALLFALGAVISVMDFEEREILPDVRFAESTADIFSGFYSSYNNDVIGAEVPERVDDCTVFGDMLIREFPNTDGLCSVTAGDVAYAAGAEGIDVYSLDKLAFEGEIAPPKGTEFFRVFVWEGSAYAAFEGEYCGFMRLSGAEADFTCVQSGTLTDIEISGGKIRLGSVYVPQFTESFDVSATEKYLPYISTQKDKMSPQSILLGGEGCGFAVSAEYSLKDGKAVSERAVMCAPLFSSADGKVTVTENSVISEADGDAVVTDTGRITACAYEDGLLAAFEENETESMVVLRGTDMQPVSAINNFSGRVTSLRLEDKILYVYSGNGLLIAADCSDPSTPKVLELTEKMGTVADGYAVCAESTDNGLVVTAYDKDGEAARYEKLLTANERGTLEFADSRAVIVSDGTFGISYDRFDGVCKVSEYALFGKENRVLGLYDDKTGYTAAFSGSEGFYLVSGAGIYRADNPPDTPYR